MNGQQEVESVTLQCLTILVWDTRYVCLMLCVFRHPDDTFSSWSDIIRKDEEKNFSVAS